MDKSCCAKCEQYKLEISALKAANSKLEEENDSVRAKNKNLERLSTHDLLTGLLNRRGGQEILDHHYSILTRDSCDTNNFAVLYLDIDLFKQINDTYGHAIGDRVLIFFGRTLRKKLRTHGYDTVIREGGDEFKIILPDCTYESALNVKQKIKCAFMEEQFSEGDIELSLRTSIGVAIARMENGEILPLDEILRIADSDMYVDKALNREERNRERALI